MITAGAQALANGDICKANSKSEASDRVAIKVVIMKVVVLASMQTST